MEPTAEAEREVIAHIVARIKQNPARWSLPGPMGADIRSRNPGWATIVGQPNTGGLKGLVSRHPKELRWINPNRDSKQGRIALVAAIENGEKVHGAARAI